MDSSTPRQHIRQQSTPGHFEISHTPTVPHRQHTGLQHRRGMSLIEPMHPSLQQEQRQRQHIVGVDTNTGQILQHYTTQEAQQHCQARPGHQEQSHLGLEHEMQDLEYFRRLQHQQLDAQLDSMIRGDATHSFGPIGEQHEHKMERARSGPGTFGGIPLRDIPEGCAVLMPNGQLASFSPIARQRPSTARSEGSFEERGSLRPDWTPYMQRPMTPSSRDSNGNSPASSQTTTFAMGRPVQLQHSQPSLSPSFENEMDTSATIRASNPPRRSVPISAMQFFSSDAAHESMDPNATARDSRRPVLTRALSPSDMFNWDGPCAIDEQPSHGPHTAPVRRSRHFDVAVLPPEVRPFQLMPTGEQVFAQYPSTPSMHGSVATSPRMSSMPSTPESQCSPHRGDVASMVNLGRGTASLSPAHRARDSVDFSHASSPGDGDLMAGDMSFEDLNLDATVEDTGISAEEVQAYISQPDPITGKWTCLYPECGKVFGRKENVRAHVQTHLGDRQYKCVHCGKCFVRQHDLKRHSKTHSGVKPYPCRCGNSFARHDALTRHRQRGICSGGFEGVVKKQAKRGRPRKARPDDDERANKSAATRKRATKKDNYAESASGTSQSSQSMSPRSVIFDVADLGFSQGGTIHGFDGTFDFPHLTLRPEMLVRTPPLSPVSTANSLSPRKALSTVSETSPRSTLLQFNRQTPDLPPAGSPLFHAGPSSRFGSAASSPPELSHSSPPSSARQLDFPLQDNSISNELKRPSEGEQQQSPEFGSLSYSDSPDQYFDDSNWKSDSLFNFDTAGSGDFKFSGSFDDEILFSDSIETHNDFF